MTLIKVRIYCNSESYEGHMEEQDALHLNRIPIPEVDNLTMYPVIEGERMKESGEIKINHHCCVNSRDRIREGDEDVIIIRGYAC